MGYIILGTAGHIDHGKTSLVKALTGTDTDRLKEEKERGITIDLGFAYLSLPSGNVLSIVDVPGHERFVKNMVAGASGIDMVLLVIAADDGVMPQTREHLDICSLLGIGHGLVAVTKSDLVDDEWLKMTIDDIKGFLKGTFLEGSPVVPVSSTAGKGMHELISSIDSMAAGIRRRSAEGIFRMPVDRSFTIKGFGTVVTGTVVSGRVKVGDDVEILPQGERTRVRGIQIHGRQAGEGGAGSRVALNLLGVEREAVKRGDTISLPGMLKACRIVEAKVSLLPSAPRPLKDGAEPMFHIHSASTKASVILLGSREMKPGESSFARVRLKEPTVAMHGDRFVLRTPDGGTVGGGIVLDNEPPKRSRVTALEELKTLASDDLKEKAHLHIKRAGLTGIKAGELAVRLNTAAGILEPVTSKLISSGDVLRIDEYLVSSVTVEALKDPLISTLESYHKKEPMKIGIPMEEVRARLHIPQKLLSLIMERLVREGAAVMERDLLRLASHKVSGGEIREKMEGIYMDAGLTPPTLTELLERMKIKERDALDILNILAKGGELVKVKDLFFSKRAIDDLHSRVLDFFKARSEMTPLDFKELTGLSRKFAIPLLEYLDSQKVTIRVGDVRRLRKG
jgi:selenocysteine-specific elongation factor